MNNFKMDSKSNTRSIASFKTQPVSTKYVRSDRYLPMDIFGNEKKSQLK
jgi:hypothetical protein